MSKQSIMLNEETQVTVFTQSWVIYLQNILEEAKLVPETEQ